jgi:hypothetical protein
VVACESGVLNIVIKRLVVSVQGKQRRHFLQSSKMTQGDGVRMTLSLVASRQRHWRHVTHRQIAGNDVDYAVTAVAHIGVQCTQSLATARVQWRRQRYVSKLSEIETKRYHQINKKELLYYNNFLQNTISISQELDVLFN